MGTVWYSVVCGARKPPAYDTVSYLICVIYHTSVALNVIPVPTFHFVPVQTIVSRYESFEREEPFCRVPLLCEFYTIRTSRVHRGVVVREDSQLFFMYISFAENYCQWSVVRYSSVGCRQKYINLKKHWETKYFS